MPHAGDPPKGQGQRPFTQDGGSAPEGRIWGTVRDRPHNPGYPVEEGGPSGLREGHARRVPEKRATAWSWARPLAAPESRAERYPSIPEGRSIGSVGYGPPPASPAREAAEPFVCGPERVYDSE